MGLDMYLLKKNKSEENWDNAKEIGYWRKANQVMGFFERKLDGIENLQTKAVQKEILEELINLSAKLLVAHDEDLCAELLPTTAGFFYGNQQYGDIYWYDLVNTVGILRKVLDTVNFDEEEVGFMAWW